MKRRRASDTPTSATVDAPASSANLGPGFDVFGLALARPRDRVTARRTQEGGVQVQVVGPAARGIPAEASRNSAGLVAEALLAHTALKGGLAIRVEKHIPPGSGLGSSGASAAACAVAVNALLGLKLSSVELVSFAAKGERASAGVEHADNVAAAILGGLVVIRSYTPLDVVSLAAPSHLRVCVAMPRIAVPAGKTGVARRVLPQTIPLAHLVHNVGHAATLVAGFALGDVQLIGKAMQDAVVEPARASLVPGYAQVRERALTAGAEGVAISGAGPSMVAVVDARKGQAQAVCAAMRQGFATAQVSARAFVTRAGRGARVVSLR